MARPSKPLALKSKNHTKSEVEKIKKAEDKLKGNNEMIYKIPSDLSKEEKKVYEFLIKELKESDILNNLDIFVLRNACFAVVGMKRVQQKLMNTDDLVERMNGDLAKNPLHNVLKDYEKTFNWCCKELGLSPSSRSAIANLNLNAQEEEEDVLLKVLRGEV